MIGNFRGPGGNRNLLFDLVKSLRTKNMDTKTEMAVTNQGIITSMFDFSVGVYWKSMKVSICAGEHTISVYYYNII